MVLDLDDGAVVFVGEGKGADSLLAFWKRLHASHARIRAVATDMSPAYTAAVRDNLPRAIHVFDRFHVVKLFNEKFSVFRQELQREAEGPLATVYYMKEDLRQIWDQQDQHAASVFIDDWIARAQVSGIGICKSSP